MGGRRPETSWRRWKRDRLGGSEDLTGREGPELPTGCRQDGATDGEDEWFGETLSCSPGPADAPPAPQVFSLIVFSSLLTDGYQNKTGSSQLHCVFNSNNVACSFAVGTGLLAFFSCLTFLALDAHKSRIATTRFKTAFQLLDLILAGESWAPPPRAALLSLPQDTALRPSAGL